MQIVTERPGLDSHSSDALRGKTFTYLLDQVVRPGRRLLDLGAGPCVFARRARDAGYEVTAVDGRTERVPWDELDGIAFVESDVRDVDVSGYDVISILGLLYHLTAHEQEQLLARCCYGATVIVETQVHDPQVVPPAAEPWGHALVTEGPYEGVIYPENANAMASIGNPTSFWHTEASLLLLFENAGYDRVVIVAPGHDSKYGPRKFYVLEAGRTVTL